MRRTALLSAVVALAAMAAPAQAAAPPAATSSPATTVTATTAELQGAVAPNQEATTYHFEYGPTAAYGARTPDAGPVNGNALKTVSAAVTGLAPATTYHFRLVARNASGTATGADLTFTTPAAAAATVTIAATPRTVTFGRSTRVAGTVTGAAAGVKVELDATPFPYTDPFKPAANGTTADGGAYALTVTPAMNTRYRVTAKTRPDTASAVVTVNVRPRVGLRLSDRTPRRGQRVRFAGSVLPAHDGSRVKLQRRTAAGWRTIARPVLRTATPVDDVARSKYAVRLRVQVSRTYRTVFTPADGDHVRGKSAKRRARVH